jgi:hypothetical protein
MTGSHEVRGSNPLRSIHLQKINDSGVPLGYLPNPVFMGVLRWCCVRKATMHGEFDREEIEHGFDLIRGAVNGARELLASHPDEESVRYAQGHFRDQVANSLGILIERRFPEGRWPTPVMMMLMSPQMREDKEDLPALRLGFELMDLYDAAVVDGEWSAFHRRLDDFEKLLIDKDGN